MPAADSIYARNKFNAHGDLILTPADSEHKQQLQTMSFEKARGLAGIQLLKELTLIGIARGAKIYFAYTPISISTYKMPGNDLVISEIVQALQNKSGCTVLGKPEDNVYPDSAFSQTICAPSKQS